ncbi:MAG TPA: ribonuclease III [Arenimonas sp.]|nr:ribonuclease III [Arenimonas sp.]
MVLSKKIGYSFNQPALLHQALRHRSAGAPHNERLEFLGDSLVNLMVAESLFLFWPKADEGALTRGRANLVRESSLASIARQLDIGEKIELGTGEMKTGGHRRDSILADTLEALIAAIYLDSDFETCRSTVLPWFEQQIREIQPGKIEKDAKTRLQEWLQSRQLARPDYQLIESLGEDHARIFVVSCSIPEPKLQEQAEGSSLRLAEMAAAEKIMIKLETQK